MPGPIPRPVDTLRREPRRRRLSSFLGGLAIFAAWFGLLPAAASAQLDERCTVSLLNRTAQVQADGSWRLDNVPANFGSVRVRATCVDAGSTRSGQSDYFTLAANEITGLASPIRFDAPAPIPTTIEITSPITSLSTAQPSVQLTVTATFSDGSRRDVASEIGTTYTTSNPAIASVDTTGRVTASASGAVVISATFEGALGVTRLDVVLSGDRDGDGLADDLEIANGLDPNDPIDALEDLDGDGLSNAQELLQFGTGLRTPDSDGDGLLDGDEVNRYGTNPALFDTDGDGLSDGLEILTGSDPLDAASYDLSRALSSLEVSPTSFVLKVGPLFGEASRQLTVTGRLIDGRSLDLTSRTRGTNYASSDLAVCSFGPEDGRIFAGTDGPCTITASVGGFSASSSGSVRTFTPTALSVLEIPGFANNVDVVGDYAYVAAGEAGLVVVDVSDRSAPQIVAQLDTPGNGNDIRIVGGLAYLADGVGGLRIVDVTDPLAPTERGALAPAAVDFRDVVLRAQVAYVADALGRLWRISVADPAAPAVIDSTVLRDANSFDVRARGVAVAQDGSFAVIASDNSGGAVPGLALKAATQGGITVVDLNDAGGPRVVGSVPTGNALDVVVEGSVAYVADMASSFTVVSLATLSSPTVVASTPSQTGGLLQDVELARGFAFGADVFFNNSMPIIAVAGAQEPTPRAILDFSAFGDDFGSGIAVDGEFVYRTAGFALGNEGTSGGGRLYIGRYLEQSDEEGIAPTVSITEPTNEATVIEGSTLTVAAQAQDDIAVAVVEFRSNGSLFATDNAPRFEAQLVVPSGSSTLTLDARAVDFGGNQATANPVEITVLPDPRTTVVGRVVDSAANPISDAMVEVFGISAPVAPDGTFSIPDVPTIRGPIVVTARGTVEGQLITTNSAAVEPVLAGITDVGTIVIQLAACAQGSLTFDPFISTTTEKNLRVVLQCRFGAVNFPLDLLRELVRPSEIVARTTIGPNEELVGTVTPDAAGRFCANLRPHTRYFLRRDDVLCDDGVVRTCSATIERVRDDVTDRCEGGATNCEDLGTIVFNCDFFGGS